MLQKSSPRDKERRTERGLSLIELLVAMAIGLIVTLAITTVLINSQGLQRTNTALNDVSQTGAFASLALDRATRSAGSGFNQFKPAFGCVLNAATNAPTPTVPAPKTFLPVPAGQPWPAPFGFIDGTAGRSAIVLAPAVIVDGGGANGSDLLVFMTGNHAFSETARGIVSGSVTATSVSVSNAMGMQNSDLVLVADSTAGTGCMVQQIAAPVVQTQVPMAGPYFMSVGATRALATFGASSAVVPLGWISNVPGTPSNPPGFVAYGLGTDNALYSYDILNITESTPVQVAENVFSMHAVYGVGTNPTVPTVWTSPTGAYASSTLWGAASPAAAGAVQASILGVRAIRIAMVMQSAVEEKPTSPPVSPGPLVLFPDLPAADQVTINLTAAQKNFRYRIVETLIPIMNL